MEKAKNPRIRTWMGENAQVYAVPITVREYHLRLEQMMDAIYTEFSQHPSESKILESTSNQLPTLINANPMLEKPNQGPSPDEQLRLDPQEVFDGVA